jgi:hypothetical protein
MSLETLQTVVYTTRVAAVRCLACSLTFAVLGQPPQLFAADVSPLSSLELDSVVYHCLRLKRTFLCAKTYLLTLSGGKVPNELLSQVHHESKEPVPLPLGSFISW